jgi:hypothetical protein
MNGHTRVGVAEQWWWSGWRHGQFADFWTINHFLAGVLGTMMGLFLGLPWPLLVSLLTALFIAWEVFERVTGVGETLGNQITDVASSLMALILSGYVFALIPELLSYSLFSMVVLAFGGLELWGYLAWRRRRISQDI